MKEAQNAEPDGLLGPSGVRKNCHKAREAKLAPQPCHRSSGSPFMCVLGSQKDRGLVRLLVLPHRKNDTDPKRKQILCTTLGQIPLEPVQ